MTGNLKRLLKAKLTSEELAQVYRSYDVIGDIAIIRVPEPLSRHSSIIGQALLDQHKNVKTVWKQSGPVSGDFRLRKLELIAGQPKTVTVHKEHGSLFKVDVSKCYFSPRLGLERMRIAKLVGSSEVVVNMFAGVGCYSILIARHSQAERVYSIDVNPEAVRYMRENVLLNKVADKVIPLTGDAMESIKSTLKGKADRVLMPLPEKALDYLGSALSAIKPKGGWVHYYGFEHAKKGEDPVEKQKTKIAANLRLRKLAYRLPFGRVVRQTGPHWFQVAVDIEKGAD